MKKLCLLFSIVTLITFSFSKALRVNHGRSFPRCYQRSTALSAKKKLSPAKLPPNVAQYIRMRDLKRAQESGASYEELKSLSINGTSTGSSSSSNGQPRSYNNIRRSGNLDARLRSVIAYKRETIAINDAGAEKTGLTMEEEAELMRLMESEEGDDVYPGDDEEAEYEAAVLKAIEQNKLKEVKRNIMIEQAVMEAKLEKLEKMQQKAQEEQDFANSNSTAAPASTNATTGGSRRLPAIAEEDMYKPKVSTWGVFKRPKDISKAYGGGRAITREEMDRLDAEMEEQERQRNTEQKQFLTASMRKEKEMEGTIREALAKGRGFMYMGNRQAAVDQLEPMLDVVSWTSDLGGEVLLELGMALETVDRSEDARKIYGKLASVSWSQKTRRSAVQLISGLDITNQIRKHVAPARSPMDEESRKKIGLALEAGLRNPWTDYKRKDVRNERLEAYSPWLDEEVGMGRDKFYASVRINTLADAYSILQRELNPLKEVPGRLLARACRKFLMTNKQDLTEFYSLRVGMQQQVAQYQLPNYAPAVSLVGSTSGSSSSSSRSSSSMSGSIEAGESADDKVAVVLEELLTRVVNGTWDIVASVVDNSAYNTRRFELGTLRRTLDLFENRCSETFPTMWGLSSATQRARMSWDSSAQEVTLTGEDLRKSPAPWQQSDSSEQTFQVRHFSVLAFDTYCS